MARQFGHTWWGRAWIDALEHRASLDPNRLPRGRTYARHGNVLSVVTEPGVARAVVRGRRVQPYRVTLRLRMFTDAEWDALAEVIVARAGRAAALLDGELPPELVDAASGAGVELLPHAGELQPRCSCPDWADPCKHSAAVCYLIADELDADPFVLLRLRGRDRDRVLAEVRRRRSRTGDNSGDGGVGRAAGVGMSAPDAGVRASEVAGRALGALPEVPHVRPAPARPTAWPSDPPAVAPFTAAGLDALVADAAARAWAAVADGTSLLVDRPAEEDLARRAAATLGTDGFALLARRSGTTPRALARRAIAWRVAGAAGLGVLDEPPWRPDRATMAAGYDALVAAGAAPARVRIDRNRLVVTAGTATYQLRFAGDGRWYRFVKQANAWELDAGPAPDPEELLDV